MKRLLGSLVVVGVLAALPACGDEDGGRADDSASPVPSTPSSPPPSPPSTPSTPSDARDPEVVDIVSGSAAGGEVAEEPTEIADDQDLEGYLGQFDSPTLVEELTASVEAHRPADGRVLGLAVIEISCDEPPSATVTEEDGHYVVTAGKVVSPHQECYAAVTSVAVVDLPA